MKLERRMALFTGVLFFVSLGIVFVTLHAFFLYAVQREFRFTATKMFEVFGEEVRKSFSSPEAVFNEKGQLLSGKDPGIGGTVVESFFQRKEQQYGGLLWIDSHPYLWIRHTNRLLLIPVKTLYDEKASKEWSLFLVSFPHYQEVSLTTSPFKHQEIENILKTHEEWFFLEGPVGPVFVKNGAWFLQRLETGVFLVGFMPVRIFGVLMKHFVYIGLTVLVFFLVVYLWFQHRVFGRFARTWQSFLEGVRRFENQDYHYRIPLEEGLSDEMKETVLAFNRLAETLEASYYANDKLFQQLRYNYHHDKLTGLPNGNKFLEDFSTFEHPNLLLFDIENFSEWNMYFGSVMGDKVLVQTAQRLSNLSIYPKTFLYKLWADRFLLVIDQTMERRELEVIATYFLENLSNLAYNVGGQQIYLSFIAGILGANLLAPGIEGNAVLTAMAGLLKKAKVMHSFFFIAEDMKELSHQTEENLKTLGRVREAIQHSYLVNFYQPIINNHSGRVEKYEALVRIQLPSGEMIPPLTFLTLAKQAKLYSFISRSVVMHALDHFRSLPYQVSLNFSPEDLADKKLKHFLLSSFSNFENPSRIVMEITESESIQNYEEIKEALKPFLALGCKLAIDDFGAGYSNFYHVFSLRPDFIKIDGSLIKNLDRDETAYSLVKSICQLAKELGAKTVAEYVHNEVVWHKVKELGVDYAQGFYFSPPVPYEKLFTKE
ncbi:MAG: EAL domain-containing protein [Brevinematales bacterium]|nr:EAL domain-containing protein [Brevinematales bacterium]